MSNILHGASRTYPPRHAKRLSDTCIEGYATSYARAEKPESKSGTEPRERAMYSAPVESPSTAQSREEPSPDPQPEPPASEPTQTNAEHPPQPCERCVRSNKVCKGAPGGRCDNCKVLHQKCSNSSGPPRGRHAVSAANGLIVGESGSSSWATRPKRKAGSKGKVAEDDDDESEEAESGLKQPTLKRRKTIKNNERRSRLLKEVVELENSIKKLQTTFSKDLNKLQQTAVSLASQIRELD